MISGDQFVPESFRMVVSCFHSRGLTNILQYAQNAGGGRKSMRASAASPSRYSAQSPSRHSGNSPSLFPINMTAARAMSPSHRGTVSSPSHHRSPRAKEALSMFASTLTSPVLKAKGAMSPGIGPANGPGPLSIMTGRHSSSFSPAPHPPATEDDEELTITSPMLLVAFENLTEGSGDDDDEEEGGQRILSDAQIADNVAVIDRKSVV